MNITTVVIGKTIEEFLNNLEKMQELSNLVELRVDYIADLKIEDIETIKEKATKKAILTCRKIDEGGNFQGSEAERIKIIEHALSLGFEHVDIELSAINEINLSQKNQATKIICSWHDFDSTPGYSQLENTLKQMRETEADIYKIVTAVKEKEDNQKLFKLLINKKENEEMIVLGMGELGRITRIFSPFLGGYLTFAAVGEAKSAPGQVELEELKEIYKKLT